MKLKMIDIYASFMQNPSRTNKMADKSETRLFDLYNAILLNSFKVTQSKRALQKLPMVERCERRGIITKAMGTKHKLEIKLRSTANFNTPIAALTILTETYTLNTSIL